MINTTSLTFKIIILRQIKIKATRALLLTPILLEKMRKIALVPAGIGRCYNVEIGLKIG